MMVKRYELSDYSNMEFRVGLFKGLSHSNTQY